MVVHVTRPPFWMTNPPPTTFSLLKDSQQDTCNLFSIFREVVPASVSQRNRLTLVYQTTSLTKDQSFGITMSTFKRIALRLKVDEPSANFLFTFMWKLAKRTADMVQSLVFRDISWICNSTC